MLFAPRAGMDWAEHGNCVVLGCMEIGYHSVARKASWSNAHLAFLLELKPGGDLVLQTGSASSRFLRLLFM